MVEYSIAIAGFCTVAILLWRLNNTMMEIDKKNDRKIEEFRSEVNSKIGRTYERLDEHKKLVEVTYVRNDMCHVLQSSNANAITELRVKLEEFVKRMEDKLSEIIKAISTK